MDSDIKNEPGKSLSPPLFVPVHPPKKLPASLIESKLEEEHYQEERVARKERIADLGMQFLRQLNRQLVSYSGCFAECKEWQEQSAHILELDVKPQILVGVLGYTGSGKSSLINALLDHEMIVPANGMRASTSVPVEIAWNSSNVRAESYKAEIQFVDQEEWLAEFDILKNDINNRPDGETLGDLPISKILEMNNNQPLQHRDLSKILGHKVEFHKAKPKDLNKAINAYIDSKNKSSTDEDGFAYWPLVKVVKIFVKAEILEHGLVLVDLPGLGDSNAGRAHVAENYIKNLRHMWVVADIVRAVDDRVASDLMGRSFKRQLLMDGKYDDNFITFIMTKTDQITTTEVIGSLGLDKTSLKSSFAKEKQLKGDLNSQKKQISSLHKALETGDSPRLPQSGKVQSKKRSHDEVGDSSLLKSVNPEEAPLRLRLESAVEAEKNNQMELKMLKDSIKAMCIRERNNYTESHIRLGFKQGLGELEEELVDAAGYRPHSSSNLQMENLKTFCVSSKAFQKICGRLKRDTKIHGFEGLDDTNIPSLQDFANECTLIERERIADNIRTDLFLLLRSVKSWAEDGNSKPRLSAEERNKLSKELIKHILALKNVADKKLTNTMQCIRRVVRTKVKKHLNRAIAAGSNDAQTFAKALMTADIAFGTWKAICRRDGRKYSTSKKVTYHWNESFLEPFLEPLTIPWMDIFRNKIPEYHNAYCETIIQSFRTFRESMEASISLICGEGCPAAERLLTQIPHLEDQLREKVSKALQAGQSHAQDSHRRIEKAVLFHMQIYYDMAKHESGKGLLMRLRHSLMDHVETNHKIMYDAAAEQVKLELESMMKVLSKGISGASRAARDKLNNDFRSMLKAAVSDSNSVRTDDEIAKQEVQKEVMKGIKELEGIWAAAMENPIVLRSRNPFQNLPNPDTGAADDESNESGSEAHESDLDSDSEPEEDESEAESDSESETSGEAEEVKDNDEL